MTVGVGRRKLSPVLLVLCIAGLLRSATAALNTPTCPAVLDAYTGGASSAKLNSGQQHTFSTTGVIQVRLNLTFGSDIDTNQVFFSFRRADAVRRPDRGRHDGWHPSVGRELQREWLGSSFE
mmetsp:Transcript_7967/g.36304  ORF Transcript_7967/g.36304 Transcript_7967/m.36304 type:complete len:122 (-) Transcript_7967:76-441(-)